MSHKVTVVATVAYEVEDLDGHTPQSYAALIEKDVRRFPGDYLDEIESVTVTVDPA